MIVQSSWKVSDGRPITDAVVTSADSKIADIEDEINVENCVMLEAPELGEGMYPAVPACQLLISCDPPNEITHVTVLCEARVIEVYGHHGEYIKTVKNHLLEEADDMVVFRGDIALDRPSSLCSIKFVLLRSVSEMWLYGVKIHTIKAESDPQNLTSVPFAAVEQRLVEMGLALSDKAEAFKQLVNNCQSSPLGVPDIGDLIANLAISNLVKNKSPSREDGVQNAAMKLMTEHLATTDSQNNVQEFLKANTATSDKAHLAVSKSSSPVVFDSVSCSTQTEEDYSNLEAKMQTFITRQYEDLDKKLWEKIEKRFEELEAKIMCKLESVESFVKPQGVETD